MPVVLKHCQQSYVGRDSCELQAASDNERINRSCSDINGNEGATSRAVHCSRTTAVSSRYC